MQARELITAYRDPVLAGVLTLAMTVELLLKEGTDLATAIPATLLACLPSQRAVPTRWPPSC